jgi:hypothetical protein
MKKFWDYIEKETLSTIDLKLENWDLEKEIEIEWMKFKLILKK